MKRYIRASEDEIDILKQYGYSGIFYCIDLYFMKETRFSNKLYQTFYVYRGQSEDIHDILKNKIEISSEEYYRNRGDSYSWRGLKSHSDYMQNEHPELFNK